MAFQLDSIAKIKNYLLKGVLIVYIIAFASLYVQVQPLFGDNGLVAIKDVVQKLTNSNNLIVIAPKLGLSYATFIERLCIGGVLIGVAALFIRKLANALIFGLLWYTYYSICTAGQSFMTFHSDLLLLEVGFISILLAPLMPTSRISQSDHDHMSMYLVKWLVFRYFVSNSLNAYLDSDKAWYNMSAIPMLAQGIQFPSLVSWHVFNAPLEYVRLYQAYELTVMLVAPFLMLLDLKNCRFLGFYSLLFVLIPSALFFNFGWTQVLMSVCLLSFLKDSYFYTDKRAKQSGLKSALDTIIVAGYVGGVVYILTNFYGLKYEKGNFKSQIQFTQAQFQLMADHLVPASLVLGLLGLLSSSYTTYFKSSKKTSIIKTGFYTTITVALFLSTFPTLTRFSPAFSARFKGPQAFTKELSRVGSVYMLSNNYLLLSRVSDFYKDGRLELQIQARESPETANWQQLDLKFKPGNPSKELSIVVPHLPRVDLKMWYAARSSLQNNQWLLNLSYRLATKDETALTLLAPYSKINKVEQVRVAVLNYKYSKKDKKPFAGYWSESKYVSDYMPPTTVEALKQSIKSNSQRGRL